MRSPNVSDALRAAIAPLLRGWRMALAWALACAAGTAAGLWVGWTLGGLLFGGTDAAAMALYRAGFREAKALWFAPFGAGLWATLAAAQWPLLRRVRPGTGAARWVLASAAAGAVGWAAVLAGSVASVAVTARLVDGLREAGLGGGHDPWWSAVGVPALGAVGCLVGAAQAAVLADRRRAGAWVAATTLGAVLGGVVGPELAGGTLLPSSAMVASVGGLIVEPLFLPREHIAVGALKFGLALGASTALALPLLRRNPDGR
jgi:hypothetical protein